MDDYPDKIKQRIENEPYGRLFAIKVVEIRKGYSKVVMAAKPEFENMFNIIQGGAVFSLADFAFAAAVNAYEEMAVAMNINISYIKSAMSGEELTAEAKEISRGSKTSVYSITVKNNKQELIAVLQAVAYIKGKTVNK